MAAKKTTAKNEPVATGDKKAALETVISRIERDCGKGSIMRLGEVANMNVEAVSTGSLSRISTKTPPMSCGICT